MQTFYQANFGSSGNEKVESLEGKDDASISVEEHMSTIHFARAFIFLNSVFGHSRVVETLEDGESNAGVATKASPLEFLWNSLRNQASIVERYVCLRHIKTWWI